MRKYKATNYFSPRNNAEYRPIPIEECAGQCKRCRKHHSRREGDFTKCVGDREEKFDCPNFWGDNKGDK